MDHQRILYADDSPADVELLLSVLAGMGLREEIAVVGDGVAVLDYLLHRATYMETRPEPPDLLLLDLKMPRMDGIEVLSLVRAIPRLKTLPVVILTASQTEADRCRCYELGANAYVVKPAAGAELRAVLESLSAFWLRLNEPPPQILNLAN
jgi:CheY-like chemotaxis protein